MTKITVTDHPYVGHGTVAKHEYHLSEGIYQITYSKDAKNIIVTFDSCGDVLRIPVDNLVSVTIEEEEV